MSFVNFDVYKSLHDHFKLSKPTVYLKSGNGADLKIVDCTNIESKIDDLSHCLMNFMLLKNVNIALLLGRDWLNKNVVMLFLDLGSQWEIPKDNGGRPLCKEEYVNCQECESDNDDYDVENFINNESNLVKPNFLC